MEIKQAEASEIYKAEYGGETLEGQERERGQVNINRRAPLSLSGY